MNVSGDLSTYIAYRLFIMVVDYTPTYILNVIGNYIYWTSSGLLTGDLSIIVYYCKGDYT